MITKHIISGLTMGTTYNITCMIDSSFDAEDLERGIKRCLKRINSSMSTFDSKSEISLFNAKNDIDPILISKDFFAVLTQAEYVSKISNGAWDGTLKPVIDFWVFGPKDKDRKSTRLNSSH